MTADAYPGYKRLTASGKIDDSVAALKARLSSCDLCPRRCGVDRTAGVAGFCKGGSSRRWVATT